MIMDNRTSTDQSIKFLKIISKKIVFMWYFNASFLEFLMKNSKKNKLEVEILKIHLQTHSKSNISR
jgi:hypothetical protein